MTTPRTIVELVDPSGVDSRLVKPKEVHINGTPVLVEANSIEVDSGIDTREATRVTLTLLVDQFTIRRGPKPEPDPITATHLHSVHFEDLDDVCDYISKHA